MRPRLSDPDPATSTLAGRDDRCTVGEDIQRRDRDLLADLKRGLASRWIGQDLNLCAVVDAHLNLSRLDLAVLADHEDDVSTRPIDHRLEWDQYGLAGRRL